jgi:Flp pilus assembly protein TadD
LNSGNPSRAVGLYRKLLAATPPGSQPDPRTLTAFGSALSALGQNADAESQFRAALAIDSSYSDAAFDLAALDLQREAFSEAETLLRGGLGSHPDDAGARRLLALALASQGKLPEAVEQLRAWVNLSPASPEPHRALAQLLSQMKRPSEAVAEQQLVVTMAANSANDWNDLGVLLARAGQKTAAAEAFHRALEIDPAFAAALANLDRLR